MFFIHGILPRKSFVYPTQLQNSLMNLATKYNIGKDNDFKTILDFLDTYCEPIGFKERLDLWDDFEDYLYDEGLLDLINE
jgi:hypothetical protein